MQSASVAGAVVPVFLLVAAAGAWAAALGRRLGGLAACGAFIAVAYVLGPPFWSLKVGPVTWNVERVCVFGLCAWWCWNWRAGRLALRGWTRFDWLLAALLGYLTLRCALSDAPPGLRENVGPWWRLLGAFWIPTLLYAVARASRLNEASWNRMLAILTCLGCYLAATAFAEVAEQWWAVFPRYIGDPTIGTHFGRARGPALMSASLGVNLTYCFWAAWMLWPACGRRGRAALAVCLPAIAAGVFLTFTRSTWLGLAGGLAVIPVWQMPPRWRSFAGVGAAAGGLLAALLLSGKVASMGRDDGAGSAEHSVYQRASFTYVSLNMFRDAPVFGHGFGRFYDKKLPYLADRKQQIELESIRGLDHHITPFSLLTETGLVGLALYLGLLGGWACAATRLILRHGATDWRRRQGLFALGVLIAYTASALFHDLTLSPTDQWALYAAAGICVGLAADAARLRKHAAAAAAAGLAKEPAGDAATNARVRLFGMRIDAVDLRGAAHAVLGWCAPQPRKWCRFVVTPNVDHAVMFQTHSLLRDAYADAALVVADGAPIVWASRWIGRPLPERVAGSDLVPAVFAAAADAPSLAGRKLRVFLLGAGPGVADRAARRIEQTWNAVDVVGTLSPPLGFEHSVEENDRILAALAAVRPDVLIVGLGAPKQELWVHRHADRIEASAALCVGATIDFLAGEKRRAPRWMRFTGLEWLHRLASEPRRLLRRYLRDAWIFPQLVWRDWQTLR